MLKVFNKPVTSPKERLEELGMEALTPSLPIPDHLAALLQCSVEGYHALLNGWMIQYSVDLHMIEKWLAVHGLSIQDYSVHLMANGSSDGLELWMASMVMNIPINMVMEDSVWTTARDGVELAYTSLLLTSYNDAILCCEVPNQDLSHEGAAAPPLQSPLSIPRQHRGRPLISIPEYPEQQDSSHSNTDPIELLDADLVTWAPIPNPGVAIPRKCPVCGCELISGMALYHHLRDRHPDSRTYQCSICSAAFNNLKERSSHVSNVY